MGDEQTYGIFKKCADNTTVSVEIVKGLEEGRSVLKELRSNTPDEYFLVDPITGNVIDPDQPAATIDPLAN